ncbi:hypothetical protein [Donghicola sp.]|jgi:hypothetical protein|uniref:hypothetical protein n=1 Tax=Donghicola sp. TaxID=1929294 RepID=UPI0025F55E23|nr:hypothetical protein [Donghicola sp.]MCT4576154.1 hypothetical protein [Donghicola sp.]
MSKIKDLERSIEVIAGQITAQQMIIEGVIVEALRKKAIDEAQIMALLTQGMAVFENNKNMTKSEAFGALGTLTSIADTIKREEPEDRVLSALTTHLMKPAALEQFCEAYVAERNRLAATSEHSKAALKRELHSLQKEQAALIASIKTGVPAEFVKAEIDKNMAQSQRVEAAALARQRRGPREVSPEDGGYVSRTRHGTYPFSWGSDREERELGQLTVSDRGACTATALG